MTTNPYLRAAERFPELKEKALEALEKRQREQAETEVIDGVLMKRARDEQGRFIADDPTTPENEAWVEVGE